MSKIKQPVFGIISLIFALIPILVFFWMQSGNMPTPDGKGGFTTRNIYLETPYDVIDLFPFIAILFSFLSFIRKESEKIYSEIGLVLAFIKLLPDIIIFSFYLINNIS